MARKPKFEDEVKTKPGRGRRSQAPAIVRGGALSAKKQASEAPTEPPPPPAEEISISIPPHKTKVSGVRPKRHSGTRAATVDEVTADMTNDPRRDDD